MQTPTALQSIQYQRGSLSILDQLKLPDEKVYISIHTVDDAWKVIHTMSIRGAPAVAVCGVLSVAVELHNSKSKFDSVPSVVQFVTDQLNYLVTARPTAINMENAAKVIIDYLVPLMNKQSNATLYIYQLLDFMEQILDRDISDSKRVAEIGAAAMLRHISNKKGLRVLTHSNTGSLATAGIGTALGIIRQLASNNALQIVFFTETRPCNQGSRLTSYELLNDRIPHTMICDSAAGLLMRSQTINVVIVGADRVTTNGDTVHDIGTYQLAVLAKHHQIPFYVAAPTTSIDLTRTSGDEVVIEQRLSSEMTNIRGMNIASEGVHVWNSSYDITPNSLITGIITEEGVFQPNELEEKLLSFKHSSTIRPLP